MDGLENLLILYTGRFTTRLKKFALTYYCRFRQGGQVFLDLGQLKLILQ